MRTRQFSRQFSREEQAMYDVWMTILMPHAVTRDYQPPAPAEEAAAAAE